MISHHSKIITNKIRGTGVALVTPFHADGAVDYQSLQGLVEYVIQNGADFLVALGTTAETATLTSEEKHQIVEAIVAAAQKRLPIVLGIGGNGTSEVCNTLIGWNLKDVDAILTVVPYYNKPSQEGIFQHFKQISDNSPCPLILYNVPSRTVVNINPDTVIRLANTCENIVGIKEASGDFNQMTRLLQLAPEGFKVLSGDDATTLPLLSLGGHGVISVIANALPLLTSKMVSGGLEGNFAIAREMHFRLHNLLELLFQQGNPAGIKALLHHKGLCGNHLRLPLTPVPPDLYRLIANESDKIDRQF